MSPKFFEKSMKVKKSGRKIIPKKFFTTAADIPKIRKMIVKSKVKSSISNRSKPILKP